MKKIRRKAIALVTILSFLLTLIPAVSLADEGGSLTIDHPVAPTADATVKVTVTGGTFAAEDEVELLLDGESYEPAIKDEIGKDLNADEKETITFTVPLVKPGDVITAKLTPSEGDAITSDAAALVPKPGAEGGASIAGFNNSGSTIAFVDANDAKGIDLQVDESGEVEVFFADSDGDGGYYYGDLYVWAEVDSDQPDSRFRISQDKDGNYLVRDALGDADYGDRPDEGFGAITVTPPAGNDAAVYKIENLVTDENGEGVFFDAHFTASDKYRIHASTTDPTESGDNLTAGNAFKSSPASFYSGDASVKTEEEVEETKSGKLTFDKKDGLVGDANKVKVQVVDKDGKDLALGEDATIEKMTPVITDQSNKDANIDASIGSASEKSLQKDGSAELTLKADKPTKADVKVTIVAKSKKGKTTKYAGTLNYEFKAKEVEKPKAAEFVVMTINSNKVRVDGKTIEIDTEAIIKKDRTFVPFRALLEAFGADVEYKDGVVTAVLDDQNVEMTLNEKDYKINDKKAVMDVAPFIQDDRTMIPVRFAAEALGFVVTPFYNDDGTTASVEFKRQ